jgi:hypothetical protein
MMEWVGWIVLIIFAGLYIYIEVWHSRVLNKKFQPFLDSLFNSRPPEKRDDSK